MFHWLFALCFAGAYLTAEGERLRLVHVALGYSITGLLVFRLLYGLFGPPQASTIGALEQVPASRPSGCARSGPRCGAGASARSR